MSEKLANLAQDVRRASVPFLKVCAVAALLIAVLLIWMHTTYLPMAEAARQEEIAFWQMAKKLNIEDRTALLNHSLRTGELPRVLPWWEHDRHMCSAVVVKYIALFTDVKLVHASAWTLRTKRANPGADWVGNERKLWNIWDATDRFAADGSLTASQLQQLVQEVKSLQFDPNKFYVMGLLWTQTHYWEQITADRADINSHVALIVRGVAIHFIDMGDSVDPLRVETLDELFQAGDLKPVWVAQVHKKGPREDIPVKRDIPPEKNDLRLPAADRELAFEQRIWPWKSLRKFLVFPSKPWYLPDRWHSITQRADTLVEKSLLHRWRNGFDQYPTRFKEIENEQRTPVDSGIPVGAPGRFCVDRGVEVQ